MEAPMTPRTLLLCLALSPCAALAQTPQAMPPATGAAQPQVGSSSAAAPSQAPLTADQQVQLKKQNADMTRAAQQVVDLIDSNRANEVWAGASPAVRAVVPEKRFIEQVAADRSKLGAVARRNQVDIGRARYPAGGKVPEGFYATVVYATEFANQSKPVRELVSFHLDEDKTWRVAGYSLR
jgi:hypothetical protein